MSLRFFLPFSKASYVNEWGFRMQVDPARFKNMENFMRHVSDLDQRKFNRRFISTDTNTWYANNALVRYEYPINEGDTNIATIRDMLRAICQEREVPDLEFFINRRDFPIITRDASEPYNHVWGNSHKSLVSHRYDTYVPIMSMAGSERYADILIPTFEDWARVEQARGKYFCHSCRSYNTCGFNVPWNERQSTAVFRGGSTGAGVTIDTNPRLKVAMLSDQLRDTVPDDDISVPYLDAGITNWNVRARSVEGDPYLRTIEYRDFSFGLVGRLSLEEQARYKYILNIPGHVVAFRLSHELAMGAVLLIVDSPWRIWFTEYLIPYEHYIPIAPDLSNLIDIIKWCRSHDAECQKISENARDFYNRYLSRDKILDALQTVLIKTNQCAGQYLYNQVSPLDRQLQLEKVAMDPMRREYPFINTLLDSPRMVPKIQRMFGLLQGVEWAINRSLRQGSFSIDAGLNKAVVISQNKLSSVRKCTFAGLHLAIKFTADRRKRREHIHEAYVGVNGTNSVVRQIPNFAYIFGCYEDTCGIHIITEWIKGQTLADYIRSPEFTFPDFLGIVMQICLALEMAQSICALVHYDLTPWNIILEKLDRPTTIKYLVEKREVQIVTTTIVPILIDFGKSHIVFKNQHYGFVNMYHTSTIQDVISLLIKSLDAITNDTRIRSFTNLDLKALLYLANFLSTKDSYGVNNYCSKPFKTVQELKSWIRTHKSYAELSTRDKGNLEKLTPMDLFKYIESQVGLTIGISNMCSFRYARNPDDGYKSAMYKGNSLQVYSYIYSEDLEQQMETYSNVFKRMLECDLPKPRNLLFVYYVLQSLFHTIKTTFVIAEKTKMLTSAGRDLYKQAEKRLEDTYMSNLTSMKPSPIEYRYDASILGQQVVYDCPYTEDTFLDPYKILHIISCQSVVDESFGSYRNIIDLILLNTDKYHVPPDIALFYKKNLHEFLDTPSILLVTKDADTNTLKNVSRGIYTYNTEWVASMLDSVDELSENKSFVKAREYMNIYIRILDGINLQQKGSKRI